MRDKWVVVVRQKDQHRVFGLFRSNEDAVDWVLAVLPLSEGGGTSGSIVKFERPPSRKMFRGRRFRDLDDF